MSQHFHAHELPDPSLLPIGAINGRDTFRSEIAELLFPRASVRTLNEMESLYPPRDKSKNAEVTRFAPSPTGFMHIGGLFAALISYKLASQSGGLFLLRIEDTDAQRLRAGALETIINGLARHGIVFDEGPGFDTTQNIVEAGSYGPYRQSHRKELYASIARELVSRGHAYPCFATEAELQEIYSKQDSSHAMKGCWGNWSPWANKSLVEIQEALEQGKRPAIRLRPPVSESHRCTLNDSLRGSIPMDANQIDAVLLKSDGHATYHFAHVVDDHFMRTTTVVRGEEWLASYPLHHQLFSLLGWTEPAYLHIPHIQKLDISDDPEKNGKEIRRKLSKRRDPEANIDYYRIRGIPPEAIVDYLMNLVNSDFESWRQAHLSTPSLSMLVLTPEGVLLRF